MHKIGLIVWREYLTRIRKRSFLLLTLLTPVAMTLVILLPLLLYTMQSEPQVILVKDDSRLFQNLKDTSGIRFVLADTSLSLDTLEQLYEELGYSALLYIPGSVTSGSPMGLELMAPRQVSMSALYYIERSLESTLEQYNMQRLGIKRQTLPVRPNIDLDTSITGKGFARRPSSALAATVVGYLMGFSIYVVLLIYGTMVMRGVMEEKSSRIVEVIITSVSPFQLMLGKILGIGAVGLTQFAAWIALGSLAQFVLGLSFADQLSNLQTLSHTDDGAPPSASQLEGIMRLYVGFGSLPVLRLLAVFGFYFLGGYLLYSALFAAVGSLSSDDGGEGQLYIFPITLPIVLSIILMVFVIQRPQSSLAFWTSLFPLTSPIIMPARMPFIGLFNWEVGLSMVLLILGFLAATALAARVYRTGILMYGKRIRPGEVWRWMWHR
jgi:ABC-2 type transport system permease protein